MNKLPEALEAWSSSTWNKLRIMRKVWTWTEGVEALYEHLMRKPDAESISNEELMAMVKARDETIQGLHGVIQDLNIELSALKANPLAGKECRCKGFYKAPDCPTHGR